MSYPEKDFSKSQATPPNEKDFETKTERLEVSGEPRSSEYPKMNADGSYDYGDYVEHIIGGRIVIEDTPRY